MQRTREYYTALGYSAPYRWAHHVEAPFPPLKKPLADRASLSSPPRRRTIRTRATRAPAPPTTPAPSSTGLFRRHLAAPRPAHLAYRLRPHHTTAKTATPGFRCRPAAGEPPGASAKSRRASRRADQPQPPRDARNRSPESWPAARRQGRRRRSRAELPVCHQTSAVARHLEANGIPTVVMGCAKDIVEHVAVPRFLFSDFPLGNPPAGRTTSQALTLELALRVLETRPAPAPRCSRRCAGATTRTGSWIT